MAMNAYRNYNNNTKALSKNLERLSSGYKINRAGDDAAGLAISEKMRAQITGLEAAQKNVKDGTSLVNTAEGAMQEIQDMLNRMVYLATQSSNGTYDNEVDRKNLQDEVVQLRSEIDRIADSANFNGIKLLDGSLGMNADAFEIGSVDAVEASDGTIAGTDLALDNANLHKEVSGVATQTPPAATIDLGSLALKASANGNATISVMGTDYTIALTSTGGAGADGNYSASDLATALKTQMAGVDKTTGVAATGAATNDAIKIGDFVFELGGTGSEVTLTYAGRFKDATTYVEAANDTDGFTQDQADAINAALGKGVKLSNAGGAVQTGDVIHDTTKVDYAIAKSPATMAGVDIKLTPDLVKQGNTLTIDGTTYTFQTEATAPKDADGNPITTNVINVSAGKTVEEQIHMAVDALSKQAAITGADADGTANGRTWTISSAGNDTIHIDQTAGTTDTTKALKTYDDIAAVISGKAAATEAANVGTSIKVTDAKVVEGDGLTIDGKKYVFSDTKTGTEKDGTTYIAIKGGAGKNLADAIEGAEFDETTNTVTIRASAAADPAPEVSGRGLTLQIGDTSDYYNQLSVNIKDMHCKSLGIDGINIGTPAGASDAINVIKDAINTVSSVRGNLGAISNRLDHTANNLSVMRENIQDAESSIRDTDIAEEMMSYTKNNILVQSAQAMLAQANQVPQGVLQLLQ